MMGRQPVASAVSDAELLDRFVSRSDESAFAALMARHGPMVLGVCRRSLHHAQDAEDAFQATFLILVRKAAYIGRRELLGSWLFGVARRVAARARVVAARRRAREATDRERVAMTMREPARSMDLSEAIDEEVRRLPAKYRGPVVLCYLSGRTNEEAAGELRCPVNTIKTRLARARDMLRVRLTRRGAALSSTAIVAAFSAEIQAAPLPPVLFDSTLKAATFFAAGKGAVGGFVSAQAGELAKGVLHTMLMTTMKTAAALVLVLAVIIGGAGVLTYHLSAKEADAKKTDKEKIQGAWKVESVTMNREEGPDAEQVKSGAWVIDAEKITVKVGGQNQESTYQIDSTVAPKTIDITSRVEGAEKGMTMLGIYSLDGDALKICAKLGGEDRPTELVSKAGGETRLIVLKRSKK
jgi:RNA polymerase sigma factor (sigma-70 family)